MSAQLEIKHSIAPPDLWHWSIIFDNGHIYCASAESFRTAEECLRDAYLNAAARLVAADTL